jgi:fumarate reductase subunit D
LTTLANDRPVVILILLLVAAFMIIRMFGTIFVFLFGIALPLALIVGHATARKPTLQNKAANTVENLSLQATPMGLLLSWLGTKSTEGQSTAPTKRK